MRHKDTVFFSFNKGTDDATVASRVAEIKNIKGVFNISAMKADSSSPSIRLIHFAKLDPSVDAESVRAAIEKTADVKYAEFPAERRAM